jgi:large subunit ribosomal protein L18
MRKTRKRTDTRRAQRQRRHNRIRKRLSGTQERPRLVVFRSLKNIEAQLVDDLSGKTLLGLSTLSPELRDFKGESRNPQVEKAEAAGKLFAEKAKELGVESVVFDRGGYQYHGRVKAFAEGAREGGLKF